MKEIIIRNKLKLARVEKDLTQEELADLVGVTRQTIALIEAGKYNPTLKLCLSISKILNKGLDELFWIGEKDDKK
ncbi:MAG: helix-turn-helix transcriptional regulator [Candidatus Humimicrobiaceae bacterium]